MPELLSEMTHEVEHEPEKLSSFQLTADDSEYCMHRVHDFLQFLMSAKTVKRW